jgi:hypothetical protein
MSHQAVSRSAMAREIRAELEAFFDLGDDILTFAVLRGRGRQSGVQVALPAIVTRVRDGLIVYHKGYAHREDALSDLGISEQALEPIAP